MKTYQERYLEHYGVKGMRWGVRKDRPGGPGYNNSRGPASKATRKTKRHAKKDAKEHARAKMYYGDGAGTRRKLIKAKVEERSKRLPGYQREFDRRLSTQDMSKHSEKAVRQRNRTDRSTKRKQRTGAIARQVTGEWGTQAAFVTLAFGGAAYLNSPTGRATLGKANSKLGSAADKVKRQKGAKKINDWLKSQDLNDVSTKIKFEKMTGLLKKMTK